jgi:TIR domain-containing protein
MTTGPRTGSEVLLQDEAARTCQGFVEVGFSRPARILVHSGSAAARASAVQLVEGLDQVLRGLGAGRPHSPPCRGELFPACMAENEPHTFNLLVWVGDGAEPEAAEDEYVRRWLAAAGDRFAVAVVPRDADLYHAIPPALGRLQVIGWDGDADRAALDVIGVAAPDSADRRVFIAYGHRDGAELALAVQAALTAARFSVFLDAFDLDPGVDFSERIEHELMEKSLLVLIETPAALASRYVIEEELKFALTQRLGIVSVRPADSPVPPLPQFVGWRWEVPKRQPGGPVLEAAAAAALGSFIADRHARTIAWRRWALEASLRAWLHYRRVDPRQVSGFPGGLRVDAGGASQYVSLRPRPANLIDMHAAFRQTPAGDSAGMVSATPRGRPEREALAWLGSGSPVSHHDEARLGRLATVLAQGGL